MCKLHKNTQTNKFTKKAGRNIYIVITLQHRYVYQNRHRVQFTAQKLMFDVYIMQTLYNVS